MHEYATEASLGKDKSGLVCAYCICGGWILRKEETQTKFGRIETKAAAILLAVIHNKKSAAINKE